MVAVMKRKLPLSRIEPRFLDDIISSLISTLCEILRFVKWPTGRKIMLSVPEI
jgi:hypothetical protein